MTLRKGEMSEIQLVLPMAGVGVRFRNQGFQVPKPLIDVHGKPMFLRVIENLQSNHIRQKFFLTLREHNKNHDLPRILAGISQSQNIIVEGKTEGAACTVLLSENHVDPESPLVIANADQIVACDTNLFFDFCLRSKSDGVVMTMKASGNEWSFVRTDNQHNVIEVAEKQEISDEASVGIYYFSKAKFFFDSAREMIAASDRTNNEFYVAPVYNYLIKRGRKTLAYNIGPQEQKMFCLGTPEHFRKSISNSKLRNFLNVA